MNVVIKDENSVSVQVFVGYNTFVDVPINSRADDSQKPGVLFYYSKEVDRI